MSKIDYREGLLVGFGSGFLVCLVLFLGGVVRVAS